MFDFLQKQKGEAPALPNGTVRRRYSIEGQVQGVGFRYRARYAAQSLALTGWVQNEDDGSVTLEVQGDPAKFMSSDFGGRRIQRSCSCRNQPIVIRSGHW